MCHWRTNTNPWSVGLSCKFNSLSFFQENCTEFEVKLAAECEALIAAIKRRQQQLVAHVRRERASKQQSYRDQVSQCTAKVHRTTGLLQYSVEVMKEPDPTAFLQVELTFPGNARASLGVLRQTRPL